MEALTLKPPVFLATVTSEPMPLGIAIIFACLMIGIGIYSWLTGFHPKWRKQVHWGRFKRGPILSPWSNAGSGLMFIGMPFTLIGDSFALPEWLSLVFQIVAALGSAMIILGMAYDWFMHLLKRS